MAMMCCQMGIDVWEVIDAAATKPFGFMPFYPGPGLGGHCIPIDPIYLLWKSRLNGFEPRFIELADNVNSNMPHFVIRRAMDLLNSRRKPLAGARVHIMGVTYKPDIRDTRESPALEIIKLLHERQAQVSYTDPYAPEIRIGELDLKSVEPGEKRLAMSDLTIIVTNHSSFDYEHLARHSPLIFDTRNATRGLIVENIIRL
jgi:UDP-N-acetyl-D-glucosamine dehydrogenase